jgi:hypothetical protein
MPNYATVTAVVPADEVDDFMRLLSHAEAVRFAASVPYLTLQAVELGAEPGDWDEEDDPENLLQRAMEAPGES